MPSIIALLFYSHAIAGPLVGPVRWENKETRTEETERAAALFAEGYSDAQHILSLIKPHSLIPADSTELSILQNSFAKMDQALIRVLKTSSPEKVPDWHRPDAGGVFIFLSSEIIGGMLLAINSTFPIFGIVFAAAGPVATGVYGVVQNRRHPTAEKIFTDTWTLFFDLLKNEYGMKVPRRLKKRFEWFSHYLTQNLRINELKEQGLLPQNVCEPLLSAPSKRFLLPAPAK